MLVTHKLEFDLVKPGVGQHINAMQNDALTREVEVTLKCNDQPWAVPAGVKAAVSFWKQDGTSGLYDELPDGRSAISYSPDRTVVKATLAPEVLTFPGEVSACLTLMDDALNKLSTFPFRILVEKNPSADGVVSKNYYNYQDLADINDHLQGIIEGTFPIATDSTLTKAQAPANAKATGEAIAALAADLSAIDDSSAIISEATGSAIALTDASNRPLRGLTIYGKTTQNGTPTPDAPVELVDVGKDGTVEVSVCGKNLLDTTKWVDSETNGVSLLQSNGNIVVNGEVTAAFSKIVVVDLHLPEGEYTFSAEIVSGTLSGGFLMPTITQVVDGVNEETRLSVIPTATKRSATFSVVSNAYISRWYILVGANTVADNAVVKLQLEAGASATEHEAYKPAQTLTLPTPNVLSGLPVTSGGNYTDENGQQWICDYKDLRRGVSVKRIAELVLTGNEPWFSNTASYAGWVAAQIAADAMPSTPVMCTHYVGVANGTPVAGQISITSVGSVIIKDATIGADKAALAAFLAAQYAAGTPVKVRYVLAEPVETPMDEATLAAYAALRTNKPNTTITNDAGAGMKVEFAADTKAYIDNKFAAVIAAIMNT